MENAGHLAPVRWFWWTVAIGVLAPPTIWMAVQILVAGKAPWEALGSLFSLLFAEGHNLGLTFVLCSLPIIALAFFIKSRWKGLDQLKGRARVALVAGVIGASLACIFLTVGSQIQLWIAVAKAWAGASTAAIAFYFLPVYGLVAIGAGYAIGWLVGWILPAPKEASAR